MRINSISVLNFMRIGDLDVDLTGNVHLFSGHNEAGKSSLQEAIRLALFGETVRVSKKGDYKMMVKEGSKEGYVTVTLNDVVFRRNVATGGLDDDVEAPPDALRYALDAHLFSSMSSDARRQFLFRALNISLKPKDIKARLIKRGIDGGCVDGVLPLLLSGGFGGAHAEAKKKTTEARGQWKGITGETYGSVKADTWKATKLFTDEHVQQLCDSRNQLSEINDQIDSLMVEKGAQAAGKSSQHEGAQCNCPECGVKLVYQMGRLHVYTDQGAEPPTNDELDAQIAMAKAERDAMQEEIVALEVMELRDKDLDKVTTDAAEAHSKCKKWKALEDLLAPDGLPAEIISEAIGPLNDRLKSSAGMSGWKQCQITPMMEIMMDGRPYQLQSESSKWRADAMISEAISHLTGMGVLVLDRVDVLDMEKRLQMIKWAMALGKTEYESILMFATLKERPRMPAGVSVYWLQDGALQEAA